MLESLLDGVRSFFLGRPSGNPEERRRLVRLRCHIPVQLKVRDKLISALVSDMGVQGMRVRLGESLRVGHRLPVLHHDPGQDRHLVVNCRVAWCRRLRGERRFSAGLVYDEAKEAMRHSWVATLLRELGLDENSIHEQRRHVRAAGVIPIWLRPITNPRDAPPTDPKVAMVNLGLGGTLLRSRQILRSGQQFTAELGPHGSLPALKGLKLEVLHCHSDPTGGGYLVALRFYGPSAEQVRLLGRYVLALLRS